MKKVNPIPKGYHTVTPYLTVEGVTRLIEFLKKVFGARLKERMIRPDGSIGHAEVVIGDSVVMMGDATEKYKAAPGKIYLYVKNTDQFYKKALAAGAASTMEPQDMFWGGPQRRGERPVWQRVVDCHAQGRCPSQRNEKAGRGLL